MDKFGEILKATVDIGASGGAGLGFKIQDCSPGLIITHSFCGSRQVKAPPNLVLQDVMAWRPEKMEIFSSGHVLILLQKKPMEPLQKAGMLSPTPQQHAGLASKPAEVSGKAPSDLNAWDLKKSQLRAGHQVTGFAGKTPILLEKPWFYSSNYTEKPQTP